MQELINKDLKEIKSNHAKNTLTEIKNTLEGINSRIYEAEERITELEDKVVQITSEEQNKGKRMKKKTVDSLRDLWTISNAPTFEIRGPRRREKEKV